MPSVLPTSASSPVEGPLRDPGTPEGRDRARAPYAPVAPIPRADPREAALLTAVLHRDVPAVRAALAAGASATDHLAVTDLGPEDPYIVPGASLLHFAVEQRAFALAEVLLQAGADVAWCDFMGRTPLHAAAHWGHEAMVTALLAAGADPLARDRAGRTPLHVMGTYVREDIPSAVLVRCAARLLTAAPAGVTAGDKDGLTLLHLVAMRQDRALIRLFLRRGAVVDAPSRNGLTPLHATLRSLHGTDRRRAATLRLLLAAGASPHQGDAQGVSPIVFAAARGQIATVRVLAAAGASFAPDTLRRAAVIDAAQIVRVIQRLLDDVRRLRPVGAALLASILALEKLPRREEALLVIGRSAVTPLAPPAPAPAPAPVPPSARRPRRVG